MCVVSVQLAILLSDTLHSIITVSCCPCYQFHNSHGFVIKVNVNLIEKLS
jgi:hypothetical protein